MQTQEGRVYRKPVPAWLAAGLCVGALLCGGCGASQEQVKKAQGHVGEGVAVWKTDQQSAYVYFQKALKEDPHNRDAHYYVALIYAMQEKFPQAEAEIREVLDSDPDYPEGYNFLGQVLVKQNRRDEAIQAYRTALSYPLYSTPDVAYYQLGLVLELEGDMPGAGEAFTNALKVSPPTVQPALVHLELGRVYYKLGEDAKARESLARAALLDKDKNGATAAEAKQLMDRLKP
ncbi:MAG: tetratricopeptide repeat protein [Nitrospiraceae bacterium]